MRLIIQIPCYNEASTLPLTLSKLPRVVSGCVSVEWLVIDDGSKDGTADIARLHGVDHVIRLHQNQGLARAFMAGLNFGIEHKADVIVNTDADNQYNADDIARLVGPVVSGSADISIGARPVDEIDSFSPVKKLLQKVGSRIVRSVSGTDVQDAPSGFRAISRKAALQLNVFTSYTYTLETIIQAGHKNIAVANVPIRVNAPTRESRLVKSIASYVWRSAVTMIRSFIIYRPMRFFAGLAVVTLIPGLAIFLRFIYLFLQGQGDGNVQSLILGALLVGISFLLGVVGVLADLIAVNRKVLERLQSILLDR